MGIEWIPAGLCMTMARTRHKQRSREALETKARPTQARSRQTFEAILQAAGNVLAQDSLRAFSINAVCENAGLTPPAVYRYFPNKYALLKAVGERLMEAEDEVALGIMATRAIPRSEDEMIAEVRERIGRVVAVTTAFPGSVAIVRALRTSVVMRQVRHASTAKVTARWFERLRDIFPTADPVRLRRGAWLGLEVSTQLMELIVEGELRAAGDSDQVMIDEVAAMIGRYYWQLGSSEFDLHELTRLGADRGRAQN
jgi:AcrR family transcriptional regulator